MKPIKTIIWVRVVKSKEVSQNQPFAIQPSIIVRVINSLYLKISTIGLVVSFCKLMITPKCQTPMLSKQFCLTVYAVWLRWYTTGSMSGAPAHIVHQRRFKTLAIGLQWNIEHSFLHFLFNAWDISGVTPDIKLRV